MGTRIEPWGPQERSGASQWVRVAPNGPTESTFDAIWDPVGGPIGVILEKKIALIFLYILNIVSDHVFGHFWGQFP